MVKKTLLDRIVDISNSFLGFLAEGALGIFEAELLLHAGGFKWVLCGTPILDI
jgi:hypothetical protein